MKCLAVLAAFAGSAAGAVLIDRRGPLPQLGSHLIAGVTRVVDGAASVGNVTTHRKRARIEGDCSSQQSVIQTALQGCSERARVAAQEAKSGTTQLMKMFFKTDDEQTRKTVSDLFSRIVEECGSSNNGFTFITCVDSRGECKTFDAWTIIGGPRVLLCAKYFNNPNVRSCGGLDTAGVMLHEMTHALGETQDFQSYGLERVGRLSAQQNIRHADTYALFANAVALSCTPNDLQTGGPPSGAQRRPQNGNIPNQEMQGLEPSPPPGQGRPTLKTFQVGNAADGIEGLPPRPIPVQGNNELGGGNGQRQPSSLLDKTREAITMLISAD